MTRRDGHSGRTARGLFPALAVIGDQHVVEEGDLFTSAGISAGIDMALRVVARHHGEAVARATARHMEYPFSRRAGFPGPGSPPR